MKMRRQFSVRGFRLGHSPGIKESDEGIFRAVYRHYRRETRIARSKYEKVAKYINDIFRALAKYDVRFDFDPMSIDDRRCEIVSASELKFICELKHISQRNCKIQGDGSNGTVQVGLRDSVIRQDVVSWADVCNKQTGKSGLNFLNSRTLLDVFTTALGRAVCDVWNEHRNVGLVYRVSSNQARIYVDIPDTGFFTVILIPAIKLSKSAVKRLNTKPEELFKGLEEKEHFVSTIYALAQPSCHSQDESFQLSYKTLENKIMNAEQFTCGRVCVYALRHLLHSPKSPRSGIKAITLAHFELAAIQEYARCPEAKDWTPAKFIKRLIGMMTSLKWCLRGGMNVNPLSGVNVFSHFDLKSLKVLAKDVEHASTKCREKLLRIQS